METKTTEIYMDNSEDETKEIVSNILSALSIECAFYTEDSVNLTVSLTGVADWVEVENLLSEAFGYDVVLD